MQKGENDRLFLLTSYDHHADGENLLVVSFGGDVAEADTGHARHGKVKRRDVHGLPGRPIDKFGGVRVIGPNVRIGALGDVGQLP